MTVNYNLTEEDSEKPKSSILSGEKLQNIINKKKIEKTMSCINDETDKNNSNNNSEQRLLFENFNSEQRKNIFLESKKESEKFSSEQITPKTKKNDKLYDKVEVELFHSPSVIRKQENAFEKKKELQKVFLPNSPLQKIQSTNLNIEKQRKLKESYQHHLKKKYSQKEKVNENESDKGVVTLDLNVDQIIDKLKEFEENINVKYECIYCYSNFQPLLTPLPFQNKELLGSNKCLICLNIKTDFNLDLFNDSDILCFLSSLLVESSSDSSSSKAKDFPEQYDENNSYIKKISSKGYCKMLNDFKHKLEVLVKENKDFINSQNKKKFALDILSNFKFSEKYNSLRANFIKGILLIFINSKIQSLSIYNMNLVRLEREQQRSSSDCILLI